MIEGFRCPVVGRVSMDMLTVDVTHVPASLSSRARAATVYGEHYSVNRAAEDAGTIGYEILTRLGGRLTWAYTT
jgi:alanine racemase